MDAERARHPKARPSALFYYSFNLCQSEQERRSFLGLLRATILRATIAAAPRE